MVKKVCKYKSAATCGYIENKLTPCPDCPFGKEDKLPVPGPPGPPGADATVDVSLVERLIKGLVAVLPGKQGEMGEKGEKGDTIIGPTGLTGLPGIAVHGRPGAEGKRGAQGERGEPGAVDEERLKERTKKLLEVLLRPYLLFAGRAKHDKLPDISADDHHVAFVRADADALYDILGGLAAHVAAGDPHAVYGALAQAETWALAQTFASGIATDTINEKTAATGVTIDGLIKIKDNIISTASGDLYVWAADTLKLVSTSGEVWLYCNSPIFRGGTGDPVHEYRDKDNNKLWAILPATNLLTFSYWDIAGGSWQPVFTLSPTGPSLSLGSLALPDSGELTISSGVITITGGWHTVDTENDDATDDLDTINGGTDGLVVFLAPENDARTVVVKHETGNISCPGGADLILDDVEDFCILIYSGAQTKWFALAGHAKYTTVSKTLMFHYPDEDMAVGDFVSESAIRVPAAGKHGTWTPGTIYVRCTVVGTGTNTILFRTSTTLTGARTTRATVSLGTNREASAAITWTPTDGEYMWVACSAVGGTAPKRVVAQVDLEEAVY